MRNNLRRIAVDLTTDASGDAVETTDAFNGIIRRIRVIRSGGAAATTTVDIDTDDGVKILDLAAGATDVTVNGPRLLASDNAGADIAGVYVDAYVAHQSLTITVDAGGDTQPVSVEIVVEELNPALI